MPDLILKQLWAATDNRTTMICLMAAGQVQPVEDPYDTLAGLFQFPPFHIHCRSHSAVYMSGFVSGLRARANIEIAKRPEAERRISAAGYEGRLPPPPATPPPTSPAGAMGAAARTVRKVAAKAARRNPARARAAATALAARRRRARARKTL